MYQKLLSVPELDVNAEINYDDDTLLNYLVEEQLDQKLLDPLFERDDIDFDITYSEYGSGQTALKTAIKRLVNELGGYEYEPDIVKHRNFLTKIINYRIDRNIGQYGPVTEELRKICFIGELLDICIQSDGSSKFPFGLMNKKDVDLRASHNGVTPLLYLTQNYSERRMQYIIFLALEQEGNFDEEADGLFEEVMVIKGPKGLSPDDYGVINNHRFDNMYSPECDQSYALLLDDGAYYLEKMFNSLPRSIGSYLREGEFEIHKMMELDKSGRNVMHRLFEQFVYEEDYFNNKTLLLEHIDSNAPDIGTLEYNNIMTLFSTPDPETGRYIYEMVVSDPVSSDDNIKEVLKWTDPQVISYAKRIGDAAEDEEEKLSYKPYLLTKIAANEYVSPEALAQMRFCLLYTSPSHARIGLEEKKCSSSHYYGCQNIKECRIPQRHSSADLKQYAGH